MTATTKAKFSAQRANAEGPLDWRRLVEWLREDGVIADDEAARTIARCSQGESASTRWCGWPVCRCARRPTAGRSISRC